jgi:hypothetical protein
MEDLLGVEYCQSLSVSGMHSLAHASAYDEINESSRFGLWSHRAIDERHITT